MQFEFGYSQELRPKKVHKMHRLRCAALLLSFLGVRLAVAQVPQAARATTAEIKTLLSLNGSEGITAQLGPAMADSVIAALHTSDPGLSASAEGAVLPAAVNCTGMAGENWRRR